jgi:hypothetical protein
MILFHVVLYFFMTQHSFNNNESGVQLVGCPRRGALLKITTWSKMPRDFRFLSPNPGFFVWKPSCTEEEMSSCTEEEATSGGEECTPQKKNGTQTKVAHNHADIALRKYNRAKNTNLFPEMHFSSLA